MTYDRETMDGIARGLAAIDATIRKAHAAQNLPAGAGLFYLLDQLAVDRLGVAHTPPPGSAPEESDHGG